MRWLTDDDLERYIGQGDPLRSYLGDRRAAGMTSERWLADSMARRMVAWEVYGPLLSAGARLRIVDVGAGFSSLSWALASRHDYVAVDLCAHDAAPTGITTYPGDWLDLPDLRPDLVVAMDLLPNVDQRLHAFLLKFRGTPMRLLLTTYEDRWYRARRVDGDELLTTVAWTWAQTRDVLVAHGIPVVPPPPGSDLFGNGRRVCLIAS